MTRVKKLYKESYEDKWQYLEEYANEEDFKTIHDLVFELCPFCDDADKSGANTVDLNGNGCLGYCKIDSSICGARDSLMSQLSTFYSNHKEDEVENIVRKIIEEIKNRM